MELTCEECGARQAPDPHPDPRCLECGGKAFPSTRCYGCFSVVPLVAKCRRCGIPTLPPRLYPAALMLRYKGVDLLSLADRVKQLSAAERADWEARYAESWRKVDEATDRLVRVLRPRMAPSTIRQILATYEQMRATHHMDPDQLLGILESCVQQYHHIAPQIPPFPLATCKAILTASVRKLDFLQSRLRSKVPARGLDPHERTGLVEHAEILATSYAPDGASFACGVAYFNLLTYSRSLILGEVYNRNIPQPVFDLEEAARGQKTVLPGVPVSLVRGSGVVWAVGPTPTPSLEEPWSPEGFVFVPTRGPSLRLHDEEGLREFLRRAKLPIVPQTLAGLIHLLLAPFSWESTVAIEGEDLLQNWAALENQLADARFRDPAASKLLGVRNAPPSESRDELVFRVEPEGRRIIYRPPELRIE